MIESCVTQDPKLKEPLIKSSTRSVGLSLARPFKAGRRASEFPRHVATTELSAAFRRRYATRTTRLPFPALKGRAKFIATLRVDRTCSEIPEVCTSPLQPDF